jgi:hypothetical protein
VFNNCSTIKNMPKFTAIPIHHHAYGQVSTHPLRQKLINYSKTFDQTTLHKYAPKYYEGNQYINLHLSRYIIHAHNLIEAYVIFLDYLNLKLRYAHPDDQYVSLQSILEDDYEENFDENENLIFSETDFHDNDTLWLEQCDDDRQIVLTMT